MAEDGSSAEPVLSVVFAALDPCWARVKDLEILATRSALCAYAHAARTQFDAAELSVVFSNDTKMQDLNATYRGKAAPTNVLSFAAETSEISVPGEAFLLGDVVLSFETIRRESDAQGKTFENHLCHLIIHGVLHLLGYDHESDACAQKMEALEITALAHLGVPNPYEHYSETV